MVDSAWAAAAAVEAASLAARLMALADAYDALISRCIYKPPLPHAQAMRIMTRICSPARTPPAL